MSWTLCPREFSLRQICVTVESRFFGLSFLFLQSRRKLRAYPLSNNNAEYRARNITPIFAQYSNVGHVGNNSTFSSHVKITRLADCIFVFVAPMEQWKNQRNVKSFLAFATDVFPLLRVLSSQYRATAMRDNVLLGSIVSFLSFGDIQNQLNIVHLCTIA